MLVIKIVQKNSVNVTYFIIKQTLTFGDLMAIEKEVNGSPYGTKFIFDFCKMPIKANRKCLELLLLDCIAPIREDIQEIRGYDTILARLYLVQELNLKKVSVPRPLYTN